jgi:hypothetical protein
MYNDVIRMKGIPHEIVHVNIKSAMYSYTREFSDPSSRYRFSSSYLAEPRLDPKIEIFMVKWGTYRKFHDVWTFKARAYGIFVFTVDLYVISAAIREWHSTASRSYYIVGSIPTNFIQLFNYHDINLLFFVYLRQL